MNEQQLRPKKRKILLDGNKILHLLMTFAAQAVKVWKKKKKLQDEYRYTLNFF